MIDRATVDPVSSGPAAIDHEALLARSTDVLSVVDEEGGRPVSEPFLGYDPETLVGDAFLNRGHPDDRDAVRDAFERDGPAGAPRERTPETDGKRPITAREICGVNG